MDKLRYGDGHVAALVDRKRKLLEHEIKVEYYRQQGLERWLVNEKNCRDFPLRTRLDRLAGKRKEYKIPSESALTYLAKSIRNGVAKKSESSVYVISGEISLDFTITSAVADAVALHMQGITGIEQSLSLPLTTLSLDYRGWRECWRVPPLAEAYRRPDVLEFSQTVISWDFLKELL